MKRHAGFIQIKKYSKRNPLAMDGLTMPREAGSGPKFRS
jgi:hypothetical protein